MKTKTESVSLKIAKELAKFFLSTPLVKTVYLFGSVAMWEDGNDIDLILEVSEPNSTNAFLRNLKKTAQDWPELNEKQEGYGFLKGLRKSMTLGLLKLDDAEIDCVNRICWNHAWDAWNDCFLATPMRAIEALNLEMENFRETDLFLFPELWQTSEYVKTMLPALPSKRKWTQFDFHTVLVWQARKFNIATNDFEPRIALSEPNEIIFSSIRRYEKMIWTRRKNEERIRMRR